MRVDLLGEIYREIRNVAARAPALSTRARTEKIYEVYILTILLRALENMGATFSVRDSEDNPSTSIDFRLGPGYLYAPRTSPGFIVVSCLGREYEIQNSLQVLGRSGILHELDVCLIDRDEAVRCRQTESHPSYRRIIFAAECKFYGKDIPLHLGREFLGLCKEFGNPVKVMVANVLNRNVHILLSHHNHRDFFGILPSETEKIEELVRWIAAELRHKMPV